MASLPPIDLPSNATGAGAFDAPALEEGPALFEYLLRLGDDSLILGQRLGEWCGHAPSVEVDLSLANIALDLIGQATHFLNRAGEVEGKGRDGDALAFHRDVLDYRNCWLVEQPNGDFARTMARQFLFSTWQKLLFRQLTRLEGRADRRGRREGRQGGHLPSGAGERMGDPPRRRDRGEPAPDRGRPRLELALRARIVRDGRSRRLHGGARHRRRPCRLARRLRRPGRAPSCRKRPSSLRPTSARSSAAAAAITPSISATCSR